jgi:capsular exopolysaccharide synthesis family protein
MSRIHAALKKAEQERAATLSSGADGAVPASAGEPGAFVASSVLSGRGDVLSLATLRERLSRTAWNFDSRSMIFSGVRSNEQSSKMGSEEFRTLRSRLYQIRERQPLRTVLITSALPSEGKTFVAANLAHVIVKQHDRSVLLIDGDLRWSRLHQALGAPSKPGLTDYLLGEVDEWHCMQRGPYENFYLVPGGKPVQNPAELLSSDRFREFLRRMAPVFDWVIIDSPPAVPVADASMIADLCDGVLLVVRAAQTPYDMAQKATHEFREKHLVGVVLNDVEPGQGYSSYYYEYYGEHKKAAKA